MPKSANQKWKLLSLYEILSRQSDEDHPLTVPELIAALDEEGISAERKSIYSDLEALADRGVDVQSRKGRSGGWFIGQRQFELAELKLLVDAVQGSRFITEKKSRQLIKKLESLASRYDAQRLQRQVLIAGRIKAMNESIYYNVDMLHDAINSDRQIRFQYFQWNVHKEQELRHGGEWYRISPWCLLWDDENYYLVAYDANDRKIKHYRVDKILHLSITDKPREGKQQFKEFDAAKYSRSLFGMYGGKLMRVTLEGRADKVGPLIDRFGKDITILPQGEDRFTASVEVSASRHFIAWIIALGDGIRITGPSELTQEMRKEAARLTELYP